MTKNGFFVTTPTPTIGKNTRKGLVFQSLSAFLNGQNFWHLKGVLPILCFLCLSPFSILEPINARCAAAVPVTSRVLFTQTFPMHAKHHFCRHRCFSRALFCSSIFSNLIKKSFGIHPGAMKLQWGASTGAWDALLHTFHCCLRCTAACIQWGFGTAADAPPAQERKCFELKKSTSKMPFCIHQSNSGKRPVFWRIARVKTSSLS